MRKLFTVLTLFLIVTFAACSKKNSPGKAPKVIKTTYVTDVLPLIQAKCTPCHLPSKGGNKANFENYVSAQKFGPDMVSRVQRSPMERGFMPFKHDKLPEEEIAMLKKWLADGLLEK